MGTWGFSILSDDTALDVYDDYIKHFNAGVPPESIRETLLVEWKDSIDDPDEGPVFWFALARAQWDCGTLEPEVTETVRKLIDQGTSLALWEEAGLKSMAARQRALHAFLEKLGSVNPRPKKPRKKKIVKPAFQPGDCLAVLLPDGQFAAVIILDEGVEPSENEFGSNLVAAVQYRAPSKPTLSVFPARVWALTPDTLRVGKPLKQVVHVVTGGYRKSRDKYELIGHLQLAPDDPTKSESYTSWDRRPDVLSWELRTSQ